MAEWNISKRVVFPPGEQRKCMEQILRRLSMHEAVELCSVSERTIRDWRREKYSVDEQALRLLCRRVRVSVPKNVELRDRYWYACKGSRLGWAVILKKYGRVPGNEEYRKEKWQQWWEQEGRLRKDLITAQKPIKVPRLSAKTAEFVGIMMGDGRISSSQIGVTLHRYDDNEYSLFVKRLIERLFSVPVSVYYREEEQALDLMVSRKALVTFCREKLGLKVGNKIKQNLDIPQWIMGNPRFKRMCLRGLVDTDGCVFNEVHYIGGKRYSYKRLNFRSASPFLRNSVFSIFRELGMTPKMRNAAAVQVEDKEEIKRYFDIIGTNNPKHLRRYKEE